MKSSTQDAAARKSRRKSKIWIVEDNITFRDCLVEMIRQSDRLMCKRVFTYCEDALRQMETDPHPDVLLLDIGLPRMSGLEGIRKFKELSPETQIVIITVHDDSDRVYQAICAGAVGYLLKTVPIEKIVEGIYDVLNGGSPINARIARKVLTAFANLNSPSADYGLTQREQQILECMTNGMTLKEISTTLFLSSHTIDTHIRSIYNRLHVNNRTSAVAKALKERLL